MSLQAQGCIFLLVALRNFGSVVPASAGLYRAICIGRDKTGQLSLQAQGCIDLQRRPRLPGAVVPASAGLYRTDAPSVSLILGCPCKRRVVSSETLVEIPKTSLSLQAQGCILCSYPSAGGLFVVPASAGLYLYVNLGVATVESCPCKRRVVSSAPNLTPEEKTLSLQAQGCIGDQKRC